MKLPDVMFGSDLIEVDIVIYIYSQCLFLNKNNKINGSLHIHNIYKKSSNITKYEQLAHIVSRTPPTIVKFL